MGLAGHVAARLGDQPRGRLARRVQLGHAHGQLRVVHQIAVVHLHVAADRGVFPAAVLATVVRVALGRHGLLLGRLVPGRSRPVGLPGRPAPRQHQGHEESREQTAGGTPLR
ncbi:hypothetical protein [Nocardiopsis salina]|uniref:hypothetical protein n=1 Tax=Nocardiopsis salina TaxID=245836 RepID=UPI001EF9D266|nr:hypothetical protein [Nocardiopsis salina]